jgi:hypothetical protein
MSDKATCTLLEAVKVILKFLISHLIIVDCALLKRGVDFDTYFDTISTLWCRKKLN